MPTDEHLPTVRELAARGVHVLVEKPLAATAQDARAIVELCARAGVHGAVGHVERFNPALLELRERVQDGQLGDVFLIATERVGPFPDRVRDVGVVKDLATHDLDLVALARRRARRARSRRRPSTGWAASTRTSCW